MDKRASKTIMKIYEGFSESLKEKPYSNLKVRDIIEKAGISRTGFYSHFKSKEEVLQGFLARLFLSVKIRGFKNGKDRVSLLFARIASNQDLLTGFLMISENRSLLRDSLLPWCNSFLPAVANKEAKELASNLLSDAIVLSVQKTQPKERANVESAFKQAFVALNL